MDRIKQGLRMSKDMYRTVRASLLDPPPDIQNQNQSMPQQVNPYQPHLAGNGSAIQAWTTPTTLLAPPPNNYDGNTTAEETSTVPYDKSAAGGNTTQGSFNGTANDTVRSPSGPANISTADEMQEAANNAPSPLARDQRRKRMAAMDAIVPGVGKQKGM